MFKFLSWPFCVLKTAGITAAMLLVLATIGCGGGEDPTVPVSGVVRFGGEPLAGVTVRFHPESGQLAFGKTDDEGRFQLTTRSRNDGALPGRYAVTVIEVEEPPTAKDGQQGYLAYAEPTSVPSFPVKYTRPDETTLSARVTRDSPNTFKFDLER